MCVCVSLGYSGSHQILAPTPPRRRSVWVICSECKIWPKIVTLSTPPHSFSRCSMTDLQHYLLILFVGEASSRLICHQQLLNVPQCAEYWWNKCLNSCTATKCHSGEDKDLGHLFPLSLPTPPVNLLSLKSFYSFMCNVENVYQLCVLIVLPFGRLAFQSSVLYSSRNFSHLGVQRLIANRFRLMYQEK